MTAIVPKLGQSNVEAMGGEKGMPPMEATVSNSPLPCFDLVTYSLRIASLVRRAIRWRLVIYSGTG
jgi:hypothetical protein